ncbi:ABC transporter permease [Saccharothrix syringae]|uniref:ABC transporter permease n=1 Tax=Saccharothrix syringae TaxID=103733 RepID=A0A5Q0H027_SACSY|nr:ABC transporter permease [Saccharothrix syringae]QFZ19204.1 ABC transporter permease [Saccharothrix syringae]
MTALPVAAPPARRASSRFAVVAGGAAVALVAAVLLFPTWFARYPPEATDVLNAFAPPGADHPFGTDQLGRDVFSRLVHGARVSVTIGLVATVIGVALGSVLGLVAAAGGRWADVLVMRLTDVWLAFPEILLALLVIALIGPGAANVAVAIGVAATPYYGRLVRGQALAVIRAEYVEAARVLGIGPVRTALRHVLPNIGGPVVVLASLGAGSAIVAAAGLSLLGLGPLPPTPEWGAMLAEGQGYLASAWWIAVFPGAAIVVVVLAVNALGRAAQSRGLR